MENNGLKTNGVLLLMYGEYFYIDVHKHQIGKKMFKGTFLRLHGRTLFTYCNNILLVRGDIA